MGLVKSSTGREGDARGPALTCFRHEGDKKKITDDFPVRLALPASCRLYQLSYQLELLESAHCMAALVDVQKGFPMVSWRGL